jgi:hypothetical protein
MRLHRSAIASICALLLVGVALTPAATRAQGHARAAEASASAVQYCKQIPFIQGVPPWGFHANAPITGATGSYARGHGDIDLATG